MFKDFIQYILVVYIVTDLDIWDISGMYVIYSENAMNDRDISNIWTNESNKGRVNGWSKRTSES